MKVYPYSLKDNRATLTNSSLNYCVRTFYQREFTLAEEDLLDTITDFHKK